MVKKIVTQKKRKMPIKSKSDMADIIGLSAKTIIGVGLLEGISGILKK